MSDETPTETEDAAKPADDTAGLKSALEKERTARKEAEARHRETATRLEALETAQLRSQVAAAKGLTDPQAERLRGSTREELEADADSLLEAFKPTAEKPSLSRRPKEALRPGASAADDHDDYEKVADRILGTR